MVKPAHANTAGFLGWTTRSRRGLLVLTIGGALLALLVGAGAQPHPAGAVAAVPPSGIPGTAGGSSSASGGGPGIAVSPLGRTSSAAFSPTVSTTSTSTPSATALAADGIPAVALDAYRRAARRADASDPSCGIQWPLLAAIGRVESDHGRFGGSQLSAHGTDAPRVIGIPLNGNGTALIRDTDGGRMDGDPTYDRAVGPMQFIPSTWSRWGVDGNGDGVADPFNIYDAAAAAADYLCAAGGDLRTGDGQVRAILSYNDSSSYLALVVALEKAYAAGRSGLTVPDVPVNAPPPPRDMPSLPAVNPGPPRALPPSPTASSSRTPSTSSTRSGSAPPSRAPSTRPTDSASPPSTSSIPLTASLTVTPHTGSSPMKITANASASRGANGTSIRSYRFTFGDGTTVGPQPGATVGHTYTAAGTYTAMVQVIDGAGNRATARAKVTVVGPSPALTVAASGSDPLAVSADASKSTAAGTTKIISYRFDFGDDAAPIRPQAGATAQHTYSRAGTYTVTVTVTDSAGRRSTKSVEVTVPAPSPSSDPATPTPSAPTSPASSNH
jgi:membrane-bound lytic murein transglycosylase B/plastocyanin